MNDKEHGDPESAPPAQAPRYPWWSLNWRYIAPWIGAAVALIVGTGTIMLLTVTLLRQTHESYRQALVAWEASLRGDIQGLRVEMNDQLSELRRQIDQQDESDDNKTRR